MAKITKEILLIGAGKVFSRHGVDGFSIRNLAKHLGIAPSAVYYYFKTEDELLDSMFHYFNHELGQKRAQLARLGSAKRMLKQRIAFQLENQEAIVAVLKYYLHYRGRFPKYKDGFLPDKSSLHIEEVLRYGKKTGEFSVKNISSDAKVVTHAINGFLLEYFPYTLPPAEKVRLVHRIYSFLIRAL